MDTFLEVAQILQHSFFIVVNATILFFCLFNGLGAEVGKYSSVRLRIITAVGMAFGAGGVIFSSIRLAQVL